MRDAPQERARTNGDSASQAPSHMPSGLRPPSDMKTRPTSMPQGCSIGFSYSSIRSAWRTILITVILQSPMPRGMGRGHE